MKKLSIVLSLAILCYALNLFAKDANSRDLYQAIKRNDPKKVEEILAKNPSMVKKKIEFYDYPIFEAVNLRAVKALKKLVEKGANINQKDKQGNTVLHYIAKNKMKKAEMDEALEFCVKEKKMKIDTKNKEGQTPFIYSCAYDRFIPAASTMIPVIEVFAKFGANLNAQDNKGKTVLHYLSGEFTIDSKAPEKTDLIKKLAAAKVLADMKGVDVNITDKDKRTPLIAFLVKVQKLDDAKKVDFITCLMENGAKTKGRSKKKESALKLVSKKSEAYKAMKKKYPKKKK